MARRSPAVAAHQRQARVTVAPRAARRKELKGTAEEVVARATERAYPPLFCELSTRAVFSTYGKWSVRYRGGGPFPTLAARLLDAINRLLQEGGGIPGTGAGDIRRLWVFQTLRVIGSRPGRQRGGQENQNQPELWNSHHESLF